MFGDGGIVGQPIQKQEGHPSHPLTFQPARGHATDQAICPRGKKDKAQKQQGSRNRGHLARQPAGCVADTERPDHDGRDQRTKPDAAGDHQRDHHFSPFRCLQQQFRFTRGESRPGQGRYRLKPRNLAGNAAMFKHYALAILTIVLVTVKRITIESAAPI